jgi:WD40 repeat protein
MEPKGIGAGKTSFQKDLIQQSLMDHTEIVTALDFSKDGFTLVSDSSDRTIRAWRPGQDTKWGPVLLLEDHHHPISVIVTQEDGSTIVSGDTGGNILA